MKRWGIYMGGWLGHVGSGEHGTPHYMGSAKGTTFKEACERFFRKKTGPGLYDAEAGCFWSVRLFDSYDDAWENWLALIDRAGVRTCLPAESFVKERFPNKPRRN